MACTCEHGRGVYCETGNGLRHVLMKAFDEKVADARISDEPDAALDAAWLNARKEFRAHLRGFA